MELEEAIKNLSEIIKLCEDEISNNNINISSILDLKDLKSLQTVLEALENSIPKKKIEEKLKEVQLPNVIVGGRKNGKTLEYGIKLGKIKAYEELLEDK